MDFKIRIEQAAFCCLFYFTLFYKKMHNASIVRKDNMEK